MTLKLPDILYVQTENEYGEKAESLDDIETRSWERINETDAVYYRAGKKIPGRAEMENLQVELDRAIWIIRELEKKTEGVSVIWEGGLPRGLVERID